MPGKKGRKMAKKEGRQAAKKSISGQGKNPSNYKVRVKVKKKSGAKKKSGKKKY